LNVNGALFIVESGVVLTLGNNVVLQGRSSNTTPLIRVNAGGTLKMENGSKVTGNTNSSGNGGGVYVNNKGAFTINGGEISGNTASSGSGGGVYVASGGAFVKQSNGVVYGSDGGSLQNSAAYGSAVYCDTGGKQRNTTAGVGVLLDSSSAGGWE
jgi:hypothetical protein